MVFDGAVPNPTDKNVSTSLVPEAAAMELQRSLVCRCAAWVPRCTTSVRSACRLASRPAAASLQEGWAEVTLTMPSGNNLLYSQLAQPFAGCPRRWRMAWRCSRRTAATTLCPSVSVQGPNIAGAAQQPAAGCHAPVIAPASPLPLAPAPGDGSNVRSQNPRRHAHCAACACPFNCRRRLQPRLRQGRGHRGHQRRPHSRLRGEAAMQMPAAGGQELCRTDAMLFWPGRKETVCSAVLSLPTAELWLSIAGRGCERQAHAAADQHQHDGWHGQRDDSVRAPRFVLDGALVAPLHAAHGSGCHCPVHGVSDAGCVSSACLLPHTKLPCPVSCPAASASSPTPRAWSRWPSWTGGRPCRDLVCLTAQQLAACVRFCALSMAWSRWPSRT